jgi:HPt (histidine-containing phosphotransfer) domain-containing protein
VATLKIPPESFPTPNLQQAIAAVWEKSLPLLRHRVTVIHRAVEDIGNGQLAPELRAEAATEAHRLAGLLGTFGYPDGTDAARLLELALDPALEANQQVREGTQAITSTLESAVKVLQEIVGEEKL